ncbi:DNA gyrase/topoisomerase IV subunit B [Caldiplasma sukawensis]
MDDYDASKIQVMEGLKAVRKVPGMYIGNTGEQGLHHMIFEVVDNSIDEANGGFAKNISVVIEKDGSATVEDDGRGIPVDLHPVYGKPGLEIVLTELHSGAKFDKKVYKVTGGLHGVGLHVVNALSKRLIALVKKDETIYYMIMEQGIPKSQMKSIPIEEMDNVEEIKGLKFNFTSQSGTLINFTPDPEIFSVTDFKRDVVEKRLRYLSYLNPDITINLMDRRNNYSSQYHHTGGLNEYIEYICEGSNTVLKEPIFHKESRDDIYCEFSIQYTDNIGESFLSFVNNIQTPEGGTHLAGFKAGISKAILDFARKNQKFKEAGKLIGEDARDGIVGIIHVKMFDPQFQGQTKESLGNSEVKGIIQSITESYLKMYLESYPNIGEMLVKKALEAAEIREASRKTRDLIKKGNKLESGSIPGKLADCASNDIEKTELYIVEGDSAGGSAKQARNREYQAVMPLRGKILNVEKAKDSKILSNQIIRDLIAVLGTGIGESMNLKKLRYGKIIIMTDADVDGAHIRVLLLTFFYRSMRQLIESGHIYFAEPPLYRVQKGEKIHYVYSENELSTVIENLGKNAIVQRFKGLGEMNPEQLWDTTMNPDSRRLTKVRIEDGAEADHLFSILMGEKVEPRKHFIEENAQYVDFIDL